MTLRTVLFRGLLLALLCAFAGAGLWGLSIATVPGETSAQQAAMPRVAHERVVLPQVGQVDLAAAAAAAPQLDELSEQAATATESATSNPLTRWATDTSELLDVSADELAGFAAAEVEMRRVEPGCNLSWVTLAAISRVGSAEVQPGQSPRAAMSAARALCSGERDTDSKSGWVAAVNSVGQHAGYVHQILATATSYATVLQSGEPLAPEARTAIDFAIQQIGLPYVWGGNGPNGGDQGFDCSGLTHAAYATAGVRMPRTAHTQYFATQRVDELRPGDLVYYGNPRSKVHHVGLYIGNGQMINAPTFGQPVQVAPVRWAGDDFAGAGRPA